MTSKCNNAVLVGDSRFEVLGLVSIALPGPWWWHAEDMNDADSVGAIFRCYEGGNEVELGYLLVADISTDASEPNIAEFEESAVVEWDATLEREIRRLMGLEGREMVRWMSSHLNRRQSGKSIVTAYIARDQGRDRQYIDVRMRLRERNVVMGGCFNVDRAGDLARPIFLALSDASPLCGDT